jgi:RNA ligase (TIGR02306 family)
MSFFGVTIETIREVSKHPGADRLDICKLEGMDFQFIVGINSYNVGDTILYFPVDSLLPVDLMSKMGLIKKDELGNEMFDVNDIPNTMLSGKQRNRIKTVKLRKEFSQGLVGNLSLINGLDERTPEAITAFLGIEKYEPEPVFITGAKLVHLPPFLSMYDIEGADRFVEVAQLMMGMNVYITEKLEGMNYSVSYVPSDDKFYVNQRNFSIIPDSEEVKHSFWLVAEDQGIFALLRQIANSSRAHELVENVTDITLYGEFVGPGIQNNIYGLKKHEVRIFDFKINGHFVGVNDYLAFAQPMANFIVPELAYDIVLEKWLNGQSIKDASNGKSVLSNRSREGIVIKPMLESFHHDIGRLILKQRSPEYLAKED